MQSTAVASRINLENTRCSLLFFVLLSPARLGWSDRPARYLNYLIMYLHCPNMALNNANFRLWTHRRLERLFPLFNRDFESLKAHKRVSYLWLLIPVLILVALCLF